MNDKAEKTYPVEAIEITVRGKKEPCYVRELSSGEVENIFAPLPKEQKDSKSTFLMRKRIVALSICNPIEGTDQGTRKYKNDSEVDAQPNGRINAEFGAAAEYNALGKDEAKAGKGSEAESDSGS